MRGFERSLLRKFFYPVASIILVLSSLFIYLWAHLTVVERGYYFNTLKKEYQRLMEDNKLLELEKAKLSSLERIEKIAREKLGLIPAGDDQIVTLVIE